MFPDLNWRPEGRVHTIDIRWPFSKGRVSKSPIVSLELQEFVPGDRAVHEEWNYGGKVRRLLLPPFACRDTLTAGKKIDKFLTNCQQPLEEELSTLHEDSIMSLVWREALRFRDTTEHPIVTRVIRLYASAFMNTRYPRAVKGNAFDIDIGPAQETPFWFEGVPLPPQLTYQFQTAVAMLQVKAQQQLRKELKRLIFAKNRKANWHVVFLCVFILLATIELVYQAQARFHEAKSGVSEKNSQNVSFVTRLMNEQWEDSAHNLINHFRCIMNGHVPFTLQDDEVMQSLARDGMSDETVSFILQIRHEISSRKAELEEIRESRGNHSLRKPLSAICELFLPDERAVQVSTNSSQVMSGRGALMEGQSDGPMS